jgi:Phytanoyl-CoA dioxygenase (PhyH)
MRILPPPEVNTDEWSTDVPMLERADWLGVSPADAARSGKRWSQDPGLRPWLDRADAEEQIQARLERGLVSPDEAGLLTRFVREGYFVVENAIEGDETVWLDDYMRDLDGVWTADREQPGLQLMSVRLDGEKREPLAHAELLRWPLELRLELRDSQSWRIHYYQSHSPAAWELAKARKLARMTYLLLDANPVLLNLTAYKYSSQSGCHQDMLFYHLHPPILIGVWVACEDVRPETGRLVVYPGSHRVPIWPGFANYPQTNYRTCHGDLQGDQYRYVCDAVADSEQVPLTVNRGDAIFTHGMLVHRAEEVAKRGADSRFSLVYHYTVPGADKRSEVEGPFNY